MTRSSALTMLEEILECPSGTIAGDEALSDLENWDSLAVVTLIAQVHMDTGRTLEARALKGCTTVSEVVRLLEPLDLTG